MDKNNLLTMYKGFMMGAKLDNNDNQVLHETFDNYAVNVLLDELNGFFEYAETDGLINSFVEFYKDDPFYHLGRLFYLSRAKLSAAESSFPASEDLINLGGSFGSFCINDMF